MKQSILRSIFATLFALGGIAPTALIAEGGHDATTKGKRGTDAAPLNDAPIKGASVAEILSELYQVPLEEIERRFEDKLPTVSDFLKKETDEDAPVVLEDEKALAEITAELVATLNEDQTKALTRKAWAEISQRDPKPWVKKLLDRALYSVAAWSSEPQDDLSACSKLASHNESVASAGEDEAATETKSIDQWSEEAKDLCFETEGEAANKEYAAFKEAFNPAADAAWKNNQQYHVLQAMRGDAEEKDAKLEALAKKWGFDSVEDMLAALELKDLDKKAALAALSESWRKDNVLAFGAKQAEYANADKVTWGIKGDQREYETLAQQAFQTLAATTSDQPNVLALPDKNGKPVFIDVGKDSKAALASLKENGFLKAPAERRIAGNLHGAQFKDNLGFAREILIPEEPAAVPDGASIATWENGELKPRIHQAFESPAKLEQAAEDKEKLASTQAGDETAKEAEKAPEDEAADAGGEDKAPNNIERMITADDAKDLDSLKRKVTERAAKIAKDEPQDFTDLATSALNTCNGCHEGREREDKDTHQMSGGAFSLNDTATGFVDSWGNSANATIGNNLFKMMTGNEFAAGDISVSQAAAITHFLEKAQAEKGK